jgi:hypothetical protein
MTLLLFKIKKKKNDFSGFFRQPCSLHNSLEKWQHCKYRPIVIRNHSNNLGLWYTVIVRAHVHQNVGVGQSLSKIQCHLIIH